MAKCDSTAVHQLLNSYTGNTIDLQFDNYKNSPKVAQILVYVASNRKRYQLYNAISLYQHFREVNEVFISAVSR